MGDAHALTETLHANVVALTPASGLLITGASGSGKSALSLSMMALGATLVSDDRTILTVHDARIVARAPDTIRGMIEARFMGLLAADCLAQAFIRAVVDMDLRASDRLPPHRSCVLLGIELPVIHRIDAPHFPAALVQFLKGERCD